VISISSAPTADNVKVTASVIVRAASLLILSETLDGAETSFTNVREV
jgi:hypothetical protein